MSRPDETFTYLTPHLSPEDKGYLKCHGRRFRFTVDLVQSLIQTDPTLSQAPQRTKILDIGPHFLTMILRGETRAIVDQLGFADSYAACQPRPGERHIDYDLNATVDHSQWPKIEAHHIVIAAEVVEHLHTSPNHWLPFLRNCLSPNGYLIITTPNAVAFKRRLLMALGQHPFELIRDDPHIPGHFREYTRKELIAYGRQHGLKLTQFHCKNHLLYPTLSGRIYNAFQSLLPPSLCDTMYVVFQNANP